MKKFLILLLFIPLTSCQNVEVRKTYYDSGKLESTVNLIEDNIEPFKELISEDNYNRNNSPTKSFFIGYWIDNLGVLQLAEKIFGITVFNSGYPNNFRSYNSDFGHYNPLFLDKLTESFNTLSPRLKRLIKPIYTMHFKIPLRRLMGHKISDYFAEDHNRNLLEGIKSREDYNSILNQIKSTNPDISPETLFWIRRNYDGTSDKFIQLLEVIMEEMDEFEREYYVSSKSGLIVREQPNSNSNETGIIHYNQKVKILSRSGEKLIIKGEDQSDTIEGEWVEIIFGTNIKGYVFDGFLRKNTDSFLTRNDGTTWTNGFSKYTFSKDMPDYYIDLSSCDPCDTPTLECHMCGYDWMKVDINSFSFGQDYQNDFFDEYKSTQFYEENDEIWSVDSYSGHIAEYESDKIYWLPADSDTFEIEKIRLKNKPILDFIKLKKKEEYEAIEKDFQI
jgi:hypothetical protein